jgi:hypothetical protein
MAVNEKYKLLDSIDELYKEYENLDFSVLLTVFIAFAVGFLLFIPKVYLKNEIYYISRDVGKLYGEYQTLKEENRELKEKIEVMNFANEVLVVEVEF